MLEPTPSPTSAGRLRTRIRHGLGGRAEIGAGLLLGYALLAGAVGGLSEAAYISLRHVVRRELAIPYFPEMLWMAPLAGAVVFLALTVPVAIAARVARTGIDVARATLPFAFLVVFGVMQSRGFPFHAAAKVVLCAGLATVVARGAARWPAAGVAIVRRGWPATLAVLVALAVIGATTLPDVVERRRLGALPQARAGARNVIMIILDTVRAANLSLHGYHRVTSPRLDRWAARGVVFERATSTAPWTLPSHASLFTGRYNLTLRTGMYRPLDGNHATLAEALRDRGYATAGFVANLSFTTRASGLARGFARYEGLPFDLGMAAHSFWATRAVARRVAASRGRPYWAERKRAGELTDAFLGWLRRRPDPPFFAFLNYFDAHDPYESPAPYRTLWGPAPDSMFDLDRTHTTAELQPWINAYDGAITYIDAQLGRLFDALESMGIDDETLVIITSDHGEMFGEHGLTTHLGKVRIPAVHVPLAMALPHVLPAGAQVNTPISLRDVAATVLDVLDAEDPSIAGHPLAALWSPDRQADEAVTISPALAEMGQYRGSGPPNHLISLVHGDYHFIMRRDGRQELYDLAADPLGLREITGLPGTAHVMSTARARIDSLFHAGPARVVGR